MNSGARSLIVIGLAALACLGPGADASHAQGPQGVIEGVYPTQLVRGQTTVLNAAIPGRAMVQSVEITPAAGVTVSGVRMGDVKEGIGWWEITVVVAPDAAPGPRTLTAVLPMGRTAPRTLTIPAHVPAISDLRVLSAPLNQPAFDVQFAAADPAGDLGTSPSVWFSLSCGAGEPEVGVALGKVASGVVRASIANPRAHPKAGAPTPGARCDLSVRASDSTRADSNTLKTTVDFK